jgi:hypothetical protein
VEEEFMSLDPVSVVRDGKVVTVSCQLKNASSRTALVMDIVNKESVSVTVDLLGEIAKLRSSSTALFRKRPF